jgi:hypothetical protein
MAPLSISDIMRATSSTVSVGLADITWTVMNSLTFTRTLL